jgi:aminopeptidase YwaD
MQKLFWLSCLIPTLLYAQSPIDESQILTDIKTLADPSWEGRGAGTAGLQKAADYLARRMKEIGLTPAGTDGYFYPFELITSLTLEKDNYLQGPLGSLWRAPHDFNPLAFSENGAVEAEVVFAGYGLQIPEKQIDDYAGLDVKDKIVAIVRGFPEELRKEKGFESKSALRYKAYLAREKGAKAVIFISRAPEKGESADDPLLGLKPENNIVGGSGLLVVHARQAIVRGWIVTPGMNPDGAEALKPRNTGVKAKLSVNITANRTPAKNIVGLLQGSDPTLSSEVVVLGAHYDHLGLGGHGSLAPDKFGVPHVGADDNASGTAGLLAIAAAMSKQKTKPKRSILFVAFSGEELGLLGSAAFVEKPTTPTTKMTAMLNMDMIGRLENNKLSVLGAKTAKEWESILTKANEKTLLNLSLSGDGYGPSDQMSFYLKKIPVLHFFTGAHSDYHKPSDTWDKINISGEAKIAALVMNTAIALANLDNRLAVIDAPPPSAPGDSNSRGYGAYLGTIPDFGGSTGGVKLSGVKAGSPAEAAGLKGGDVLTSLAGKKLASLEDMTFVLRELKPGQEVEITYLRDGKEAKTKAIVGKK